MVGLPNRENKQETKIQDDLAVSESDEETDVKEPPKMELQQSHPVEESGDLWF